MSTNWKNMYELLPAVYKVRDADSGERLKAFFEILQREGDIVEDDIAQLYNNWFIETSEEWVIPYIGGLLGVRGLHGIGNSMAVNMRAYVANTISYRRRKGIAPVLEQLALDVSGWRAHAVEFFELLGATQYMNHIRQHRTVTPDLRKMNDLDLVNSPFDSFAHSVDVRHISSSRGKYNIPNLGIFLWRLQSYPVVYSEACKVPCPGASGDHYFTFHPSGLDEQLFNFPQTESEIINLSSEINLPVLLRRRALHDELETRRKAIVNNEPVDYLYFDNREVIEGDSSSRRRTVFEIFINNDPKPLPPEEILICNLNECCKSVDKKTYRRLKSDGTYEDVEMPITVSVDPVLGKFVFSDPDAVTNARVSYSYGFSGDVGAGTYNRQASLPLWIQDEEVWHVGVSKISAPVQGESIYNNLKDAVDDWNSLEEGKTGIISIMDNSNYVDDIEIVVKRKSKLIIVAADWLLKPDENDPSQMKRFPGNISADGLRPYLSGKVTIRGIVDAGNTDFESRTGGSLELNGLWVNGKVSVLKGNLASLVLNHTTVSPITGSFDIGVAVSDPVSNQWLKLEIQKSILGPVNLRSTFLAGLNILDSIIDGRSSSALVCNGALVKVSSCTFLGKVSVRTLEAENSIFTNTLFVERRQTGCVRFSYAPLNSRTPRKYRCQPDMGINEAINDYKEKNKIITKATINKIRQSVSARIVPLFTTENRVHHAYGQLSQSCPQEILTGADNGSEMGVFCFLKQPQRMTNLRIILDEYLPLGLESGLFFVT